MSTEPTSILCFRNGSIGNTLAAVPALRALRQSFPKARLAVVVDPIGHDLLRYCTWIDELIAYDKRGRDHGVRAYWKLVRRLRRLHPSHTVLFKRFFRNGLLAWLSRAKVRAGFVTEGRAPFLNVTIPYDESIPVVDLNLRLANKLGATSAGREYELSLSPEDRVRAAEIVDKNVPAGGSFVVAHYGGLTTSPDFLPPGRFAEILRAVASATDCVFLTGHGTPEANWADELVRLCPNARPVVNLPIRTTAALLERSRLFIGFNSGPTHLAAALRVPEIIFFRPDPRVADEIRKWCPPGDRASPLVPPRADDETAWESFLANVQRIAARFPAATLRHTGGPNSQ